MSTDASPIARERARDILVRSPAFWELPEARRNALAEDMAKVAAYIAGGATGSSVPRAATLAGRATPATGRAITATDRTAGQRFAGAGDVAARQGAGDYTGMVRAVNFPAFVSGLIDG